METSGPLCTWVHLWRHHIARSRTTVPALTLTLTLAVPRAHAGPTPACPRPPRLPAGQSISTLIALQFTIHRSPPRSGQQLTLTRRPVPRPQRPLNLIPRRGRPLHRAPLRSGRHLKLTRSPARTRPSALPRTLIRPAAKRPPIISDTSACPPRSGPMGQSTDCSTCPVAVQSRLPAVGPKQLFACSLTAC